MSDDLEDFAEWRESIESRVRRLEVAAESEARVRAQLDKDTRSPGLNLDVQGWRLRAVTETQSDHTFRLMKLEVRAERLAAVQAKILAGVQTIIGLLEGETATCPNSSLGRDR